MTMATSRDRFCDSGVRHTYRRKTYIPRMVDVMLWMERMMLKTFISCRIHVHAKGVQPMQWTLPEDLMTYPVDDIDRWERSSAAGSMPNASKSERCLSGPCVMVRFHDWVDEAFGGKDTVPSSFCCRQ